MIHMWKYDSNLKFQSQWCKQLFLYYKILLGISDFKQIVERKINIFPQDWRFLIIKIIIKIYFHWKYNLTFNNVIFLVFFN